ncbi:AF4/FMR2 family member 4 [Scaptodrosophila lebanonensis]|uniref:AF4/FMR2 family member 4 n=1 Tax=Drosophila lebanonensis TaxID=7225 RepID=A0A6J2U5L4_DROLE|nr:AF4/FMR2 family member 4 [Scaptodrosophila lebanonensis]
MEDDDEDEGEQQQKQRRQDKQPNDHEAAGQADRDSGSGSGRAAAVAQLPATISSSVMSTPPDVILEVGPAPATVRFVAHALVLGMHSGYLRSAIRLDETTTSGAGELLLYLGNVTAEQFAPLLTYMYTGYLDLNVDNIFAVLLATHVLHMPRALEICRSFLARAQTEGYLSSSSSSSNNSISNNNNNNNNNNAGAVSKIIRPIPSKATMPNFGFLPLPPPPPAPPPPPPPSAAAAAAAAAAAYKCAQQQQAVEEVEREEDEEDVEVFIDSNTITDNEAELDLDTQPNVEDADIDMDCNVSVVSSLESSAGSLNIERVDVQPKSLLAEAPEVMTTLATTTTATTTTVKPNPLQAKHLPPVVARVAPPAQMSSKSRNSRKQQQQQQQRKSSGGLQVAKAPIPAAQLDASSSTVGTAPAPAKFIIDVASCDGPVRFRRILNTAYGHKPDAYEATTAHLGEQRTQQSVSYSFHQQMAKTISSQQRQQQQQQQQQHQQQQQIHQQQNAEESENSGDATPQQHATIATATAATATTTHRKQQQTHELYVCIYCKHTFKSQYCYQKHAKRHLNPLSLSEKKSIAAAAILINGQPQPHQQQQPLAASSAAMETSTSPSSDTEQLLRREVRPLDMNVQYYPCKTCGSKFPSYYFVHKHRKLCHADEIENATATTTPTTASSTSALI